MGEVICDTKISLVEEEGAPTSVGEMSLKFPAGTTAAKAKELLETRLSPATVDGLLGADLKEYEDSAELKAGKLTAYCKKTDQKLLSKSFDALKEKGDAALLA